MNVLTAFWVSAAAALGFSALTVLLLRRPLDLLLAELCGSASRARFWLVFTSVSIVLVALLGMLFAFPLGEGQRWAEHPLVPDILSAFRVSLFFLLAALGALAFVLLLGISSYERDRRYARRTSVDPWAGAGPPPVGT